MKPGLIRSGVEFLVLDAEIHRAVIEPPSVGAEHAEPSLKGVPHTAVVGGKLDPVGGDPGEAVEIEPDHLHTRRADFGGSPLPAQQLAFR